MSRNTYLLAAALGAAVGWFAAGRGTKTVDLRIWDVVALGPWLVTLAHPRREPSATEKLFLAFAGGATIGYNGRNLLVAREEQKA